MKKIKRFISTEKGKVLTTTGAAVLVAAVSIVSVTCMTGASNARTVSASREASPVSSDDGTFAAAAPVNTTSSINLNSSTNGLHIVIGGNSSTSSMANGKTTTTNKNIVTKPVQIKTQPTLKSTNYPSTPAGPKGNNPAAPTYKGYTRLDMTDFSIGNAMYAPDGAGSRCQLFANKVAASSNEPKSRMGDPVMPMDSVFYYYGTGEISLSNMINVLMKQNKYVTGSDGNYIVTGIYDHSGITYNRTETSSYSEAAKQNSTIFQRIYSKGFVNNSKSKVFSFSAAGLFTKASEYNPTTGYVRAVVFTLKKI